MSRVNPGLVAGGQKQDGGGGYTASAVHFSSGSLLERSLTVPDSSLFSFSLWTKWTDETPLDGYQARIYGDASSAITLANDWNGPSDYFIAASNADGSAVRWCITPLGVISSGVWYNILGSLNTNFSSGSRICNLYINDVSYSDNAGGGPDSGGPFQIAFNQTNIVWDLIYGSTAALDMADCWMAPGVFIDFTVTQNRRKFIGANGKPVSLGASGETPTGSSPLIFLSGDSSSYGTNLGTGGSFSLVSGAITNASTSPSD